MVDRRRILGGFAVFALVLLRVVIGWHFLGEGLKKVEYDRHDGELRLDFSAAGFMTDANGPLAKLYHSQAPDDHAWRELLAAPRPNVPPTAEETAAAAKWKADFERRRAEATKKGEPAPVEFPPGASYHDWAERVADDWQSVAAKVKAIAGLSDEQKKKADAVLSARLQQLSDYLASQAEAITEYRHELWRLGSWRDAPEAGAVPFHDERIAAKTSATRGQPGPWLEAMREIEAQLHDDLRHVLNDEQRALALTSAALDAALTDPRQSRLEMINVVVTCLTIGVGACLLVGLFTRLASLAGALFLLGVILSQPPWLYDAVPTMPQIIEFAGLLVLAGTRAGRWLGLDYFAYALFHRPRAVEG